MIAYSLEKHHYVITKDKVTGKWELECRYCSQIVSNKSHAKAVVAMDILERYHRGLFGRHGSSV